MASRTNALLLRPLRPLRRSLSHRLSSQLDGIAIKIKTYAFNRGLVVSLLFW